ncbi:MAG: hypothetical protein ABI550_01210 [Ignavibacteriaceae bacterium]
MNFKKIFFTFLLVIFFSLFSFPQQSKLSKGVNYISDFIASDYFENLKSSNNDLALTDTIFLRAVKFYNNEIDEALLALTFACVPYKKVPVRLPLINAIIYYPLTSANDSTFKKKNENLPKYLYFDSPNNNYGDKDKLAHFFGSAYVSYASNIFDLGDLIGYFVENFEESFKVQSSIDERDLQTNKLGNIFGKILKKNKSLLPSNVFLIKTLFYFRYNL